jgi:hypothetical protein
MFQIAKDIGSAIEHPFTRLPLKAGPQHFEKTFNRILVPDKRGFQGFGWFLRMWHRRIYGTVATVLMLI